MTAYRLIITVLVGLPSALAHAQSLNTLTEAERKEGWVLLFDGTSLKGWHTYNTNGLDGKWEVQDGTIHLLDRDRSGLAGPKHDLATDETFGDFDLKAEWKISPKGDAGILFHVQEGNYGGPYETGPEVQVVDNDGNPNGQKFAGRAGSLYAIIPAKPDNARAVGQWNQVEVVCRGGQLKIYQNGEVVVSTSLDNDSWKRLVTSNSANKWTDVGSFPTGKIDLQDWCSEVWFRNIKVRRWATAAVSPTIAASPATSPSASPATDQSQSPMTGAWRLTAGRGAGLPAAFANDDIELFSNGMGISKPDRAGDVHTIKFFQWVVVADSFRCDEQTASGKIAQFRWRLAMDGTTAVLKGKAGVLTFHKSSDNPLEGYVDHLPAAEARGEWQLVREVKNGKVKYVDDIYYDIYPSTDAISEAISYELPTGMHTPPIDSLAFCKYFLQSDNNQLMDLVRNSPFAAAGVAPRREGRYLHGVGLLEDGEEDDYCRFADGVYILSSADETDYYVKVGPVRWDNIDALHKQVNTHYGRDVLGPFGFHWVACTICHGTGNVEVKTDETYIRNGVQQYKTTSETCTACNGKGGNYINDKTGEEY